MGPKEFDAYMQHVLDTQFTPAEKSLKKSIIKKINKVQKKRGRKIFKEEFVVSIIVRSRVETRTEIKATIRICFYWNFCAEYIIDSSTNNLRRICRTLINVSISE